MKILKKLFADIKERFDLFDSEEVSSDLMTDMGANAWISPVGDIFPIAVCSHFEFARNYLDDRYNGKWWSLIQPGECPDDLPFRLMAEFGWIRVMHWRSDAILFQFPSPEKRLPHRQKKAVIELCLDNNQKIPKELRDN